MLQHSQRPKRELRWQHHSCLWSVAEPGDLLPGSLSQEWNCAAWAAAAGAPAPGTLWTALEARMELWTTARGPQVNVCLLSQHKHSWAPS